MFSRPNVVAVVLLLALVTAIEVLLVGKTTAQETPVGAGIAIVAVALALGALAACGRAYRFRTRWLGIVPRLAVNLVRDTLLLTLVLARRLLRGELPQDRIEEIPFEPGGDDPESAARRALVVAGISLAPNTLALDVDRERKLVRIHRLTPGGGKPASARWPV